MIFSNKKLYMYLLEFVAYWGVKCDKAIMETLVISKEIGSALMSMNLYDNTVKWGGINFDKLTPKIFVNCLTKIGK